MEYRVRFKAEAREHLDRLPQHIQSGVRERVEELIRTGRIEDGKKLHRYDGLWSVRVGEFRLLYLTPDPDGTVWIRDIGSRGDIYRHLEE